MKTRLKIFSLKQTVLFFLFSVLSFSVGQLCAQRTDTVAVYSPAMKKEVKVVVIVPAESIGADAKAVPAVYLLHGFGGNYGEWLGRMKPTLPVIANSLNMIFVCPDGKGSWYWDSPVNSDVRYETFVSKELPDYIDKHYPAISDRKSRAVTGYSMGGHGALWLAFRHPDVFGACGSMSGGVDIRPFPGNWDMSKQLGEYAENQKVWDDHTVINQIYRLKPEGLAIIIDCGTHDFFYDVNQKLHEKLLYNNIPHDYLIRPGGHTQEYWRNAVDYQLLFFSKYFAGNK